MGNENTKNLQKDEEEDWNEIQRNFSAELNKAARDMYEEEIREKENSLEKKIMRIYV